MPILASFDIKRCFDKLPSGDVKEFEQLFNAYKKKLFSIALKMLKSTEEAEEVVQEVFLSLWQSRSKLGNVKDPEAYLFTITYNTVYSHLRKLAKNLQLRSGVALLMPSDANSTEEEIVAHETNKMIREAIRNLPIQQRTVYELNKLQGLSYNEIADYMHISNNTVRNHLSVASKTVRIVLKKWSALMMLLLHQ